MSAIELRNITKSWGVTTGVDNVSFTVDSGSFSIILGPSGCGKSTSLRMIAGLEEVTKGHIWIAGKNMTDSLPAERELSMVFQSYALFPHLNVKENIVFGLKVRKVSSTEQASRLSRVADIVGLSELMDRRPGQLSGGQRQRVALARAIIAENKICLMDEPLSNLDAKLRHDMRVEIRSLQQRLKMTVVYVTHDQTEAMSMGDKIILMRDGHIEQEGTPEQLYDRPATIFAASFIGMPPMHLLRTVEGEESMVLEDENRTSILAKTAEPIVIGIRPEHISICDNEGVTAELMSADYLGSETIIDARIAGQQILVRHPGRIRLPKPITAKLRWQSKDVHIFNAESGIRIDTVSTYNV